MAHEGRLPHVGRSKEIGDEELFRHVDVSDRRVSSQLDLILHLGESRLSSGPVDWIEINYPSATVHALGIDMHQLIWLLIISMITALVFKNRFRVTF